MPQRRLNLDKNQLIELYLHQRLTLKEIAKVLGCSYYTVRNYLVEYGIPLRDKYQAQQLSYARNPSVTKRLKSEIIYWYVDKQKEQKEVASILGISKASVRACLVRNGIKTRSQWDIKGRLSDTLPASEIIKAYIEEKQSLKMVGDAYGVSPRVIAQVLDKHGIKRRTYSESRANAWERIQAEQKERSKNEAEVTNPELDNMTVEEKIIKMRDEDALIQDIASALNVTKMFVLDVLNIEVA